MSYVALHSDSTSFGGDRVKQQQSSYSSLQSNSRHFSFVGIGIVECAIICPPNLSTL